MYTPTYILFACWIWVLAIVVLYLDYENTKYRKQVDVWRDEQEALNKAVARHLHSQEKYNAILSDKIQEHDHE